jgi:outer membrane protein insertion porin family
MIQVWRLWAVFVCVSSALLATQAFADQSYKVDKIAVEGNKNIDTSAIKIQLKAKPGNVSSTLISDDIKSLYRTGFFDQVTASVVSEGANQILKFAVIEKPVIRKVYIKGNKEIKESELSAIFAFGANRFLDNGRIDSLVRAATTKYETEGFYDVHFEHSVVPVGENQVDLSLTVVEGKRYRIRKITIKGLKDIDPDDVRSTIQTRRYKWWSSWLFGTGRLNRDMLDNDKNLIRQYFLDNGYIDGTVSDPSIDKKEDGIYISFDATEGRQYKLDLITASGDLIKDSVDETLKGTKAKKGDVFRASQVRDDAFIVNEKFGDEGYAFANVVPDTSVNKDGALVSINFKTDKGKLVAVNQINITGNDKTYDNVIRREMAIGEQEQYSGKKVKRSQQLLQRLGYFQEVGITNSATDQPDKVDLDVNVHETSTGSFSVGAGYSTSDGPLFNTRLSENNIMGTGRSANAEADIGTKRNNFIVSLDDPRVNDSNWSLGTDLQYTDIDLVDYSRRTEGASLVAGYPLDQLFGEWAQDIKFYTKYEFLNINIRNVSPTAAQLVKDSAGNSSSSAVTPRLVRNTINNPLDPSDGSRQDVSFEYGGLGGTNDYELFEAKHQFYYPLFSTGKRDVVFSWRTRLDYGESQDDQPFPLFKRFFPGGINSVRGYKTRHLGPADPNGARYGGSKELVNNFEGILPLVSSAGIKAVIFWDQGQAFDDNEEISLSALRQGYGWGFRWASPIGPIRIEIGYPINRKAGEKSSNIMFSFGAPFN